MVTLGHVSEMVGRKVFQTSFQTSFRPLLGMSLGYLARPLCKAEKSGTYIITYQDSISSDHIGYDRIISDLQTLMPEGLTPPGTNPKLEKGRAHAWLERHPVKFQKVKK